MSLPRTFLRLDKPYLARRCQGKYRKDLYYKCNPDCTVQAPLSPILKSCKEGPQNLYCHHRTLSHLYDYSRTKNIQFHQSCSRLCYRTMSRKHNPNFYMFCHPGANRRIVHTKDPLFLRRHYYIPDQYMTRLNNHFDITSLFLDLIHYRVYGILLKHFDRIPQLLQYCHYHTMNTRLCQKTDTCSGLPDQHYKLIFHQTPEIPGLRMCRLPEYPRHKFLQDPSHHYHKPELVDTYWQNLSRPCLLSTSLEPYHCIR